MSSQPQQLQIMFPPMTLGAAQAVLEGLSFLPIRQAGVLFAQLNASVQQQAQAFEQLQREQAAEAAQPAPADPPVVDQATTP